MKKISKKILSIVLSILMVCAVMPISVSAATTSADLQSEIEKKSMLYSPRIMYTNSVVMSTSVPSNKYYQNLLYSSRTLSKGYAEISTSIDATIQVPYVTVGVYDGMDVPKIPVSAYIKLKAPYIPVSGIVLTYENKLYELAGPDDFLGCTSVWTGDNYNVPWIEGYYNFNFTSRRADYPANLKYTRGDYNGYDISVSNALKVRYNYLISQLAKTNKGFITSDYNDTTFQFVTSESSGMYEYPNQIHLGDGAIQYIIDYSPIMRISEEMLTKFNKIKETSFAYDEDALVAYYQAILDIMNFNLKSETSSINDNNVYDVVNSVSAKIKTLAENYNIAVDNLGEEYVDPAELREYVQNNYISASLNVPKAKITFGSYDPFDYVRNGKTYNFGKNLIYCSPTVSQSSQKTVNNVNSWICVPSTVVMIYDGVNETSFPVKVGFGTSSSTGEYSGSYLHSLYMGQESVSDPNLTSTMFKLGNSNWLVCNAAASIEQNAWCKAGQINGEMGTTNAAAATGTNLSKQYGGFFNKIVLDNGKYSFNKKIDPIDGKDISFYFRYANPSYDTSSHCVANSAQQFVLNVKPMVDKLAQMKEDYGNTIAKYGADHYTDTSVLNYDKAINNLINFDISTYFKNCSDATAYSDVERCLNDMTTTIAAYDKAYSELSVQYVITFTNYAGEIVDTQIVNEGEKAVAPQNTEIKKISDTSRYHYVYSWPTINAATSNLNYKERRASILCTLDEGVQTKDPTCQENGEITYTCSVCNGIMLESIDKTSHDYTKYVPTYKSGETYSKSLTHHLQCSTCDDVIITEPCSFELAMEGTAVRIYQCKKCGGMATENKAKYDIVFKNKNGDIISQEICYEGGKITVPDLPNTFVDDAGHHSFKWNVEPVTTPTESATYIITETVTPHQYTSYVYNNDAAPQDKFGTETAKCDIVGCDHTNTRKCAEEMLPSTFVIKGKICIANDRIGTASEIVASDITLTVDDTEINAVTDENGEYIIEDVEAGIHTITISSDNTIDRTISVNVSYDIADVNVISLDDIGIVVFDYNKDGKINTVDASLMSQHNATKEMASIFKKLFNKVIAYDTIEIA